MIKKIAIIVLSAVAIFIMVLACCYDDTQDQLTNQREVDGETNSNEQVDDEGSLNNVTDSEDSDSSATKPTQKNDNKGESEEPEGSDGTERSRTGVETPSNPTPVVITSTRDNKQGSQINVWAYVSFVAMLLAIMAIVVSIFKAYEMQKGIGRLAKKCSENDRKIEDLGVQLKTMSKPAKSSDGGMLSVKNLEDRVKVLENKMRGSAPNPGASRGTFTPPKLSSPMPVREPIHERVVYSKINSNEYFTQIVDSNQEGCVYKITLKSDTEGEFTIISLDKIRSSNGWKQIVEYTGVSIEQATDFTVESCGVCKKYDSDTWQVIQPLKIKLTT